MATYSRKLIFKLCLYTLMGTTAAAAIGLSWVMNRWAPDYIQSYADLIEQQFQIKITFKKASYSFPSSIVFHEVGISDKYHQTPMFKGSRLVMDFSFPLTSRVIRLHQVVINGFQADWTSFKEYYAHWGGQLRAWAKKMPEGQVRVSIPDGNFVLPHQTAPFNLDISLDKQKFNLEGAADYNGLYTYKIYGRALPYGLFVDKFNIESDAASVNLWGSWQLGTIETHGYIFYEKFYILDIDSSLQVQPEALVLNHLSFTLDKDKVHMSGRLNRQGPVTGELELQYQRSHINRREPLKNLQIKLHTQGTKQGFSFSGETNADFLYSAQSPLQYARGDFHDLRLRMLNGHLLDMGIGQLTANIQSRNKIYTVSLERISANLDFSHPYHKSLVLSTHFFEGSLRGHALFDTTHLPWKVQATGDFENIDINRLGGLYEFFRHAHGALSGGFNLESAQSMVVSGDVTVRNAGFAGSALQNWLAETMQMPSLADISGAQFTASYKIDARSKMLDDFKLTSDQFDLSGFFHLDSDLLVESQMAVRFPQGVLQESAVGKHILGLVQGAWTLPFEFSLSGNIHRVNFQWNTSPLKDEVRGHLFKFFERAVDRRMDAHPYYNVAIPNESVSPG